MSDTPQPSSTSSRPQRRLLTQLLRGWRISFARLVKVTGETRTADVRGMIEGHGKERIAYWIRLLLAMGIATYGLVLGSTGVVIGAMLVSPLMGPLVEIGVGLVTGSPVLVLYSLTRTLISIVVVVLGSAALTLGVPYHELTSEILARTSPTLIDLYVASLCALAAAYTTARQSSDTISAAAGTAISIALVPPLCVVGWGIGSGYAAVSYGAALLFTANLCAILFFTVITFFLLAYDTVDIASLEAEGTTKNALIHRLGTRLRTGFGSKYGPVLRLGMPLVFVVAIYFPLRRALQEVAWKARVRDGVQRALEDVPGAKQAVRSSVTVEMNRVSLRLVIVGDNKAATRMKNDLTTHIKASTAVSPIVEITAVPDSEAMRLSSQVSAVPIAQHIRTIEEMQKELDEEVRAWWPARAAGVLASWALVVGDDGSIVIRVVHFGSPLGGSGEALLARALEERLGSSVDVVVRDVVLSTERVEGVRDREMEWVMKLAELVDRLAIAPTAGYLCVTAPITNPPSKSKAADIHTEQMTVVRAMIQAQRDRLPPARSFVANADTLTARLAPEPCVEERDGGVSDGSVILGEGGLDDASN